MDPVAISSRSGTVDAVGVPGPDLPAAVFRRRYPLGRRIGEPGAHKVSYLVDGRDDLVIGVMRTRPRRASRDLTLAEQQQQLDAELAALGQLARMGFPILEVVDRGVIEPSPGAPPCAAYVTRRYATCWRDNERFLASGYRVCNERTLADLARIERRLRDERLVIDDLQFGILSDGHLIITDTPRVYRIPAPGGRAEPYLDEDLARMAAEIANVRAYAEKAIAERRRGA